jgi:hypothetical protein
MTNGVASFCSGASWQLLQVPKCECEKALGRDRLRRGSVVKCADKTAVMNLPLPVSMQYPTCLHTHSRWPGVQLQTGPWCWLTRRAIEPGHFEFLCCSKIAEAEAAVSVNEKKWLVMHMHVQLQLDELRGPQTLGSL